MKPDRRGPLPDRGQHLFSLFPRAAQDDKVVRATHQFEDSAVHHLGLHPRKQALVRDRIKVAFQVRIHHVGVPFCEQLLHPVNRTLTPPAGPETKTPRRKFALENRLQHHPQCRLYNASPHRRNTQRAFLR